LKKVSFKKSFFKKKCLLNKECFKKHSLKSVTIQYLLVGGCPHGAEILNRHRFQTIFLKDFFKRYFVLKDTFFQKILFS